MPLFTKLTPEERKAAGIAYGYEDVLTPEERKRQNDELRRMREEKMKEAEEKENRRLAKAVAVSKKRAQKRKEFSEKFKRGALSVAEMLGLKKQKLVPAQIAQQANSNEH